MIFPIAALIPNPLYTNPLSAGSRTSLITATASVPAEFGFGGSVPANLVNGSLVGDATGSYLSSGLTSFVSGNYFQFDFLVPKFVSEAKIYMDRVPANGTWKWQYSSDGSSFSDLNSFTWNTQTQTQAITGWPVGNRRYLRMTKVGTESGTDAAYEEFEFKITV